MLITNFNVFYNGDVHESLRLMNIYASDRFQGY